MDPRTGKMYNNFPKKEFLPSGLHRKYLRQVHEGTTKVAPPLPKKEVVVPEAKIKKIVPEKTMKKTDEDVAVEHTELSRTTKNILQSNGYHTVSALKGKTIDDLKKLKGIGLKSAEASA